MSKPLIVFVIVLTVSAGLALALAYGILSRSQPAEVRSTVPRFMGLPPAPECDSLYNTGRHREWAACMGVPYRISEGSKP